MTQSPTPSYQTLAERLDQLAERTGQTSAAFLQEHGAQVEIYRTETSEALKEVLARLRADVRDISGGNVVCEQLTEQAAEYVDWLQWTLWDLPYLAIAMQPPLPRFRSAVAACGLLYLSIRIFDDVIDRHFWYKGRHPTLMSVASQAYPTSQGAEGLTILAGLLLCFEGLAHLVDPETPDLHGLIGSALTSVRRAVIGAIMEFTAVDKWDLELYERLVQLKNVDYWRSLYLALDPDRASPLYPFLERYYALAQYLNDVRDFAEDQSRGQPNLLALYISDGNTPPACLPLDGPAPHGIPLEAERRLADTFDELESMAASLPDLERSIAELKLGESLRDARRLGLCAPEAPSGANGAAQAAGLSSHFELRQVIEQMGGQALERVDCPVCGSGERNYLFQKQGFAFHRCSVCTHVYVSPRLIPSLQARVGDEMDNLPDDPYLDVQRVEATNICRILNGQAPGPRLLDIGFGRGYLMQAAHAYGFEVYGLNSSAEQVDNLRPQFGRHVHVAALGDAEVPMGPFDAVVMTHVVEHLGSPVASLNRVRQAMSPGAVLYVAVPDMESVQFRVFGKKWDVVSPLGHLQYFNEKSMRHLLTRSGFVGPERVPRHPRPTEAATRWVMLMRSLGGDDAGELAMVAHNPRPSAETNGTH